MKENTPASRLVVQAGRAAEAFADHYGEPATHLAAAPGRVNLIGEHTDYNAGLVMPMAIERWTVIAARPRGDVLIRLRSTASDSTATIDLNASIEPGEPAWANYVRGVVAGWLEQAELPNGCDALIDSSVPLGSGLSSSAALTVSFATLLESLSVDRRLKPIDKAQLAQQAEHTFAGVPCGLMDQWVSAGAQADHGMQIDFSDHTEKHIALPNDLAVIITHCGKPHALVGGEYAARRSQCESAAAKLGLDYISEADAALVLKQAELLLPVERQRAMHVVQENARVWRFGAALEARDWPTIGACMYDSHASMRDLFEITTPELDTLVDLAAAIGPEGGVIGSRMTGGGFGGSTVTLTMASQAQAVCEKLAAAYREATGLVAEPFVTRAAGGAGVVDLDTVDHLQDG